MLFIWCLLGGLICLFAPRSLTGKLQLAYTSVFSWPLEAGRDLSLATAAVPALHTVDNADADQMATEQRRLRNHIANLEARLKQAQGRIDHLGRLRAQPQWDRMQVLPADIRVPGETHGVLIINRGRQDGVTVGQYVLGDISVIGTVSDVAARSARVKLITDPTSKIPVTVGDRATIMEGHVGNKAKVVLVPATEAIRKGDPVYARKTAGLLDVPIIAGRISQCGLDPKDPSLMDITVQPACDIATLAEVVVIIGTPQLR